MHKKSADVQDRIRQVTVSATEKILQHPFIADLSAGRLPHAAFERYLSQNYHYLAAYARALSQLAARSSDPALIAFLSQRAAYTVETEQAFGVGVAQDLGLDYSVITGSSPTPAGLGYANFIKQAAALEPVPVALAAMLPCYAVYSGVAERLSSLGSPDPVYQRWIDMYVGDDFESGVSGAWNALTESMNESDHELGSRMVEHARVACRYEWWFWESAYRDQTWPGESE